jgi:predicted TIM-barrel fold metal-dependent hydrolase
VYADELIRPWYDSLRELVPGIRPFDIHTHTGWNDPDGFAITADKLVEALEIVDGRAAFFTLADPAGYRQANDRVLAEAEAVGNGRLVPFCRIDPRNDGVGEAERALAAGAKGIKFHPRAENFRLADPEVEPVIALAHERKLPLIVHAGRGIPALGRDAVDLAQRYPDVRLILAHAGISDLAWIWREVPGTPNLLFDTAWWTAADLLALFAYIPPGQILFGSDAPYGTPLHSEVMTLRCALQAGVTPEQAVEVMGGQAERIIAGEDPVDLGPAPGPGAAVGDLMLDRVYVFLLSAVGRAMGGGETDEYMALSRLACEVGEEAPQAHACKSILALLDRHDRYVAEPTGLDQLQPKAHFFPALHLLILAATVARTPSVPVPEPDPEDLDERRRA